MTTTQTTEDTTMTTTQTTTQTKETTMNTTPSHVLCNDAFTFWIEDYDPAQDGNPVSQVVETYDSERDALEGLAKARAQQASDGDEELSYAEALASERRLSGRRDVRNSETT